MYLQVRAQTTFFVAILVIRAITTSIGKGDRSDLLLYCTRGKEGGLQAILTQILHFWMARNVKEIQQSN